MNFRSLISASSSNECNIILLIIYWLLYIDYLYILCYLHLQFWNMHSEAAAEGVLKKISSFTGTPVLGSLFYKVAILQDCNFTKKRLKHSCFPVKFEILKNTYLEEHLMWTTASVCWLLLLYWFLQFTSVHIYDAWGSFLWKKYFTEQNF